MADVLADNENMMAFSYHTEVLINYSSVNKASKLDEPSSSSDNILHMPVWFDAVHWRALRRGMMCAMLIATIHEIKETSLNPDGLICLNI